MHEIIRILRRRKWLLIVPFLISFCLPVFLSFIFLKSYEADALIWLDSDTALTPLVRERDSVDEKPIQTHAAVMAQLLKSRSFLNEIIKRTDLKKDIKTAADRENVISMLENNLNSWVAGPNSLKLMYSGSDPRQAAQIVEASADLFMKNALENLDEQNDAAIQFFETQLDQYGEQQEANRQALQGFKEKHPQSYLLEQKKILLSPVELTMTPAAQMEYDRIQKEFEYTSEYYDETLKSLARAEIFAKAERERYQAGFSILDPPVVATTFSKKKLLLFDVIAFLATLFIGGGIVAIAEWTDPSLRTAADVDLSLGLPVLASISRQN